MGRVEGGNSLSKAVQRSSTLKKDTHTRAVHRCGQMDTTVVEGTIPGRCHPFGVL